MEGVNRRGELVGSEPAAGTGRVVEEAADLMYFLTVALERAGASLADVERELDRRALKVKRRVASEPKGMGRG